MEVVAGFPPFYDPFTACLSGLRLEEGLQVRIERDVEVTFAEIIWLKLF